MRVTGFYRRCIAFRREQKFLLAMGYEAVRPPWDLESGGRMHCRIVDARIGADGKTIYVKVSND